MSRSGAVNPHIDHSGQALTRLDLNPDAKQNASLYTKPYMKNNTPHLVTHGVQVCSRKNRQEELASYTMTRYGCMFNQDKQTKSFDKNARRATGNANKLTK